MAIVGFDYGHGGRDPGATYKGRKEADDVLRVGMKTARIMRNNGVTVDETRTTDKTLSLTERSRFLNRKEYDYVVSFHRNSAERVASGSEVFAHPQSNIKSKKLSKRMNDELVKVGFKNRGAKTANFHMLREVNAYAVLPEIGFINNPSDNKIFDDNIDKIAEAIAKSLLIEMGINYKGSSASFKPAPKPAGNNRGRSYMLQGDKGNDVRQLQADLNKLGNKLATDGSYGPATKRAVTDFQRKYKLKVDGSAGNQVFNKIKQLLKPKPTPAPNRMYRVVTGSFGERKNAEERIAKLKKAGFESFIDIYDK